MTSHVRNNKYDLLRTPKEICSFYNSMFCGIFPNKKMLYRHFQILFRIGHWDGLRISIRRDWD
jgi:Fe-S-cluster containining protein